VSGSFLSFVSGKNITNDMADNIENDPNTINGIGYQ